MRFHRTTLVNGGLAIKLFILIEISGPTTKNIIIIIIIIILIKKIERLPINLICQHIRIHW
jgi:hypothetical protein